ncbi:hypothetical protein NLZ15_17245 [Atlantibacter subterranea]|uniref:hypothetical protein n=1 Tax=Atlantibacter subterraneus TaxID=255519 RepID=UPI0020C33625|nr:hypothetical protein [Atlantibacter subterranea]UTJ46571.1 hypothetical protein NLZ15_17245 [Atlantibacter subterranea]
MAYGVKLFNSSGVELVGRFVPSFFVDYITSGSGTRTYAGVVGKSLTACPLNYITAMGVVNTAAATVSVSGNTLNYSNASPECPILVVYQ